MIHESLKRKFFLIFFFCFFLVTNSYSSSNLLTKLEALEDIKYLVDVIESTHPDPYSAIGGKIKFSERAQYILQSLPDTAISVYELYAKILPFINNISDLHTSIKQPEKSQHEIPERYLPIRFKISYDKIYVSETKLGYEELKGFSLEAVNDIPVKTLIDRVASLAVSENKYGRISNLAIYIRYYTYLKQLFPEATFEMKYTFQNVQGESVEKKIPLLSEEKYFELEWASNINNSGVIDTGMVATQFLDDQKKVAYLRYRAAMTREAFRIGRSNKSNVIESFLKSTYKRYMNIEMPEDINEAIEKLPSLTKEMRILLQQMKENKSSHLIIDIRRNGGGWTESFVPMLYLLYGDKYFENIKPDNWSFRISEQYLKKFDLTIDQFNQKNNTNLNVGEYLFERNDSLSVDPVEKRNNYLSKLKEKKLDYVELIDDIDGVPVYNPKIIVLVSPRTSSSAYHLMYYLWKLGAIVVGVPPAQAGNAFMDYITTELPNSKLKLNVSSAAVEMFPDDPVLGRTFIPQQPMHWFDYLKYDFDVNAEILFALYLIESGKIN